MGLTRFYPSIVYSGGVKHRLRYNAGDRDDVRSSMKTQSFNPSGEYASRTLECFEPFEAVMICPEYNFIAQEVVSEVLQ